MMYDFLYKYKVPLQEKTFLSKTINSFYYYAIKYYQDKLDKPTIQIMINQIQGFEKFMYFQYPELSIISDINESHVLAFRDFCYEGLKNTIKTVNKKLTSLKYFFKYLVDMKLIKYNITLNVSKLRLAQNRKPTIFTTSELKVLYSEMKKLKYGIRDLVITKLVLTTGIKIQDILKLSISQIDMDNKLLIYKTNPYPLGEEVLKNIQEYLYLRTNELDKCYSDYLFLSNTGNIYQIRSYQMQFKAAMLDTSIAPTLSPRFLRTTFLYNMAKVVEEEELRDLTNQNKLNQYYDYLKNPLQNLI